MLTTGVLRSWARTALVALGEARSQIDDLNVYPVPDGDTGTNMYLTWEAACQALPEGDVSFPDTVAAFSRGALLGARGNSGVITSQLVRACGARLAESAAPGGKDLAEAMVAAADAAYGAVAKPVEGTILTVAREAALAAERAADNGGGLAKVCLAAAAGGRAALGRTTEQLEVLRRAGVVDAGGAGLVVVLEAMESALSGRRRPRRQSQVPPRVAVTVAEPGTDLDADGPAYEVMYLLDAPDDPVRGLRDALDRLGDSVVVVGGDGLWNVHVHTDDVGAAIEAGIAIGRPHRIRVTHFADLAAAGAADRPCGDRGRGRARPGRAVPRRGRAGDRRRAGTALLDRRAAGGDRRLAARPRWCCCRTIRTRSWSPRRPPPPPGSTASGPR